MPERDAGTNQRSVRIGLCADCAYAEVHRSGKGSEFYLCLRSKTDPRFAKYPRLPVLLCSGYEQRKETDATS